MQMPFVFVVLMLPLQALGVEPVAKVLSMLSELQAKITKEGESAQAEYARFTEWCEDRSRNLGFEIKTGKAGAEELRAAVAAETATSSSLRAKIDELAASVAADTADLEAANQIRAKERRDFVAEEKDLMETIDIINRAVHILQRQKGASSMMQVRSASNLAQALNAMLQASVIGSADAARLNAFIQDSQQAADADSDDDSGAPAGAVYQSQSGNIIDILEDLSEKADSQLDATRKKEVAAANNYAMLKQSLSDEISFANKEMDEAKKGMATSAEKKSTSAGDLEVTSKELASDVASKDNLHLDCMTAAREFQATSKSRAEELTVLAAAQKALREATGAAALDQVSFIQLTRSRLSSREDLARFEAVRLVRDLARKQHSDVLAQLASQMASTLRAGGAEPFEKVKGLIRDMVAKLEAEAGADATRKAYCDKELSETRAKKLEKTSEIELLTSRVDQMSAKSAKLKEEIAALESELSKLAQAQSQLDKLRLEERESYTANKAEQSKGLDGVKLSMKLLRDYYSSGGKAHEAAGGAAGGVIGLLEVIESDMTKTIASLESQEESAVEEYETMSKKNEIERTAKQQDVKYKLKESKQLDKGSAENTADRQGVQAELDAIVEYLARIEAQCTAKPEAYADRARHREAEIAGLKHALQVLQSETALIQRLKKHRTLRGAVL